MSERKHLTREAQQLLLMYAELRKIQNRGAAENKIREFFGSWQHEDHAAQYREIATFLRSHPAVVIELVGDQMVDDETGNSLLTIMGHGGSVSKKDNPHMVSVYAALRKCNVSDEMRVYLNWLWDVHGY